MKRLLKISLFFAILVSASCYTSFTRVDVLSDEPGETSWNSSTFISALGFVGDIFSSSLFFDNIFTHLLFAPIEYLPSSYGNYYYDSGIYQPYGYGTSITYITYNYWSYTYPYWTAPYKNYAKPKPLYAARKFKKRQTQPVKKRSGTNEPGKVRTRSTEPNSPTYAEAFKSTTRTRQVKTRTVVNKTRPKASTATKRNRISAGPVRSNPGNSHVSVKTRPKDNPPQKTIKQSRKADSSSSNRNRSDSDSSNNPAGKRRR